MGIRTKTNWYEINTETQEPTFIILLPFKNYALSNGLWKLFTKLCEYLLIYMVIIWINNKQKQVF